MAAHPLRIINRLDAERLQRLIDAAGGDHPAVARVLEGELMRGEVVDPEQIPDDVVSMCSQVRLSDPGHERAWVCTLVYPHALASTADGLSVMSPAGVALLGRRVGDTLKITPPEADITRLRIEALLWQPERAGQYHR